MINQLMVSLAEMPWWAAVAKMLDKLGVPEWIIWVFIIIVIGAYLYNFYDKSKTSHSTYHYEPKSQDSSKETTAIKQMPKKETRQKQVVVKDTEETEVDEVKIVKVSKKPSSPAKSAIFLPARASLQRGRYNIIRHLASGGFGNTYLAHDNQTKCDVAIKELYVRDKCSRETDTNNVRVYIKINKDIFNKLKQKFIKEARRLQLFQHPNIVKVYDCFKKTPQHTM